jgi:hypothetical protein
MTTSEKIKQITILAIALCVFPVMFIGIALLMYETTGPLQPKYVDETYTWIFRACTLGILAFQFITVRNFNERFTTGLPASLDEKLKSYRVIMIVRMAMFEAGSFFATVAFLLNGDYIQLGISGIAILLLFSFFPTRARMRRELQLNELEL